MDAVKDGPAVTYRNMGKLLIGSGTGARTPAVDAAAALLLDCLLYTSCERVTTKQRCICATGVSLRFGESLQQQFFALEV